MAVDGEAQIDELQAEREEAPPAERGFAQQMDDDEDFFVPRWLAWGYRVIARWLTQTVIGQAVGLWLITRALYALLTLVALLFLSSAYYVHDTVATPHLLVAAWDRGATQYYFLHLARYGYTRASLTVFYPLYPLLIAGASALTGGGHLLVAALVVSNLGTLGACVALALLAQHELQDAKMSRQSVRVLLAYPLAFFLTAGYTEGMFIAFAALALLSARRGWWYRAALCAWLATETRISGVALFLPLLVEFGRQTVWWRSVSWRQAWWRQARATTLSWRGVRRSVLPACAVFGAVPLALVTQAIISQAVARDPLAFVHAERSWGHQIMWPWQAIGVILGGVFSSPAWSYLQARAFLDLIPIVFCTGILALNIWHRWLPASFVLYAGGLIYLSVASPIPSLAFDPAVAAGRYLLPALPIVLLLARWSTYRPQLDTALVTGGFAIQAVLAVYWLQGGWII